MVMPHLESGQWRFLTIHIGLYRSALYGERQLPIGVIASHFLGRDVVCMYDCPRTWIAIAELNHTGLWLQGSIEPCQCMRCVSSQFDLDDMPHCAPPPGTLARQINKIRILVTGELRPAATEVTQVSFCRLELHARRDVALDLDARLINFEQSASPLVVNTDKR